MGKKIVALLTCIIIIISALCIVPISDAGSTAFNITNQTKTIEVGKTFQIKLNGVKANKIKWKSSNKSIATVSKTGTVKGLKVGKTKISGKYKDINFIISISVEKKSQNTTEEKTKDFNLYIGTCANVDFYYINNTNEKIYIKAVNKNSQEVNIYFDYINFDDTTIDVSTNSFISVSENDFRVIELSPNNNKSIAAPTKTISGYVLIRDKKYEDLDSGKLNGIIK